MIGHPSGYGPQEKNAYAWMQSYGCITWMVRRVFEEGDDMTPGELMTYTIPTVEGDSTPIQQFYQWCLKYGKETFYAVEELKAQQATNYAILETLATKAGTDPSELVSAVKKSVDAYLKKLKAPEIDYDAIADAIVAKLPASPTKKEIVDEIYKRLKA